MSCYGSDTKLKATLVPIFHRKRKALICKELVCIDNLRYMVRNRQTGKTFRKGVAPGDLKS